MSAADVFREITTALVEAGIPYMVVGSYASNIYGTGRATQDIDLVVSATPDRIRGFLGLLSTAIYYFDVEAAMESARRKSMFNILDITRGWKVDIIFEKPAAYHRQAFSRRTTAEIEQVPLIAATAEDVIVSKLEWAKIGQSQRQIEDVTGVLNVQQDSLDFAYIEKWVKELGLFAEWGRARKAAGLE